MAQLSMPLIPTLLRSYIERTTGIRTSRSYTDTGQMTANPDSRTQKKIDLARVAGLFPMGASPRGLWAKCRQNPIFWVIRDPKQAPDQQFSVTSQT